MTTWKKRAYRSAFGALMGGGIALSLLSSKDILGTIVGIVATVFAFLMLVGE